MLQRHRDGISGLIHCTGGGQTKCKGFGRGLHYVKDDLFEPPPIFRAIQQQGNVPWREMFEIFNMGHRMEIFCDSAVADDVMAIASEVDVEAKVVGRVESHGPGDDNALTIRFSGDEFRY